MNVVKAAPTVFAALHKHYMKHPHALSGPGLKHGKRAYICSHRGLGSG